MINELYQLSETMDKAGVKAQRWHSDYKEIPNIKQNAPCVRIFILRGKVVELSSVPEKLGKGLRKYGKGTNAGSYPCMNLAPLYRITDDAIKKSLSMLKAEDLAADKIAEIRSWCQNNNWGKNFQSLYRKSMVNQSAKLLSLVPAYKPLQILVEESSFFSDPMTLHQALESIVFRMLEQKENVTLALQVLFYQGKKEEPDKYGSLSVAFESPRLIDLGVPAVNARFVSELNSALIKAEEAGERNIASEADAFGFPVAPGKESTPMPAVKLAAGFDVKLRTMFREQHCQIRYGRIEDGSYPISPEIRRKLKTSLEWLGGSKECENVTWMNTGKREALFAYPSRLPEQSVSYTRMFGRPGRSDVTFEEEAKQFLAELRNGRKGSTDSKADRIQLFILRKIDKARTKVVYTRQTDACELEKCSGAWILGCFNLPVFVFGKPKPPFPLETANILNRFWKQDGTPATEKCKPVPKYHGLELLMEPALPVTADLHTLSNQAVTIGAFLGNLLAGNRKLLEKSKSKSSFSHPSHTIDLLALIGLMLYREGIGKERYMEDFFYQYGQLLKVSDELHALYCRAVRKGELPPQLAGSSLYQAAAEAPLRTMNLLAQRMQPYIAWAKTYRSGEDSQKNTGVGLARWYLWMYEEIAGKLYKAQMPGKRFGDVERAQLFIGYLAALPKRKDGKGGNEENMNQIEEVE